MGAGRLRWGEGGLASTQPADSPSGFSEVLHCLPPTQKNWTAQRDLKISWISWRECSQPFEVEYR